jgi:phospholipase C
MKKMSAILGLIIIISILLVGSITTGVLLAVAASPFSNTTFLTATPIKHFVLLYQENNSFDHYFGTYPNATNPAGEPKFVADPPHAFYQRAFISRTID